MCWDRILLPLIPCSSSGVRARDQIGSGDSETSRRGKGCELAAPPEIIGRHLHHPAGSHLQGQPNRVSSGADPEPNGHSVGFPVSCGLRSQRHSLVGCGELAVSQGAPEMHGFAELPAG